MDVIASATGSLDNPDKLEKTFKTVKGVTLSAPTIRKYLDYFEDAFLIRKAKRYNVEGRKRIGGPLKCYFVDVGLRNARLNFRQQEPTHIMENAVNNELVARGYSVDVGIVEIHEGNDRKQVEIDFVANEGSRCYYVQSAFVLPDEEKRAQEERPLISVPDSLIDFNVPQPLRIMLKTRYNLTIMCVNNSHPPPQ